MIELAGSRGVFAGVRVELRPGESVTVGRSRFVDVSAAKTPMALRIGRDKLEKNSGFRRMSRRHFEVRYEDEAKVVITDLSRNGVILDGSRINASAVVGIEALGSRAATLRFGAGEELHLKVRQPALAVSPDKPA
jgi:hypothetical protein